MAEEKGRSSGYCDGFNDRTAAAESQDAEALEMLDQILNVVREDEKRRRSGKRPAWLTRIFQRRKNERAA